MKGGNRDEHLKKHLEHTDQQGVEMDKEIWADLQFRFESDVDPSAAMEFLKGQKEMIFGILGGAMPGFEQMLEMFATMDFLPGIKEKNVITLRFKATPTVQQMLEGQLGQAYSLIHALPNNQEVYFAIKSKNTFSQLFEGNVNVWEAFKGSEIDFRLHLVRDYLRKIATAISDPHISNFAQILTAPTNLNLDLKMEIDNLLPQKVKDSLSIPCSMGKDMVMPMVNSFLGENSVATKLSAVSVVFNAEKIYGSIRLKVPGLLK